MCVCVCVCACVRACVLACIRACVCLCVCYPAFTVFIIRFMKIHNLLSSLKFVAFINCSNFEILGCL